MTEFWEPYVDNGEPPSTGRDDGYVAPGHRVEQKSPVFKTAAAFCAEYVPLAYTLEGIVRSGSLYTLTARTGAGKTAFLISTALAVSAERRDMLGVDVEPGRVAYIACENPDDIRMRLMTSAFLKNVDLATIGDRLLVLDAKFKPEDLLVELQRLATQEPFRLIVVDTLAAFFDGDDMNNSVQGGEFMRRLRPLTRLAGLPSVIVAAHPVKQATEENLLPYGSGAILNEVDGNLTLWKDVATSYVALHWLGKLRGLEFNPTLFRFETASSPSVLDDKGRQVQLPCLVPVTIADSEARQEEEIATDVALLRAIFLNPEASQRELGNTIGRSAAAVNRKLQRMARPAEKLVEESLGKYRLTKKGRNAVSQ